MAMRSHTDLMAVKLPKRMRTTVAGKEATAWHQDTTLVQSLSISFWIALTANSPEMGTMQFRNGSHHLGPLYPPLDEWPRLQELPISEASSYKPGDATAHVSWTAHCAAENDSDRPRWAYICSYLPSDAPFLGIPSQFTDRLAAAKEIAAGKPLAHSSFPLVYGGREEQA
jgi:ectoine hydroxylase-related dioxygenase (phytanoyl-CoA dioxygenase family)